MPKKYNDDELLGDLRRVARFKNLSYVPFATYKEHGNHSGNTLTRRFGSWREVNVKAGLLPTDNDLRGKKFGRLSPLKIVGKKDGYFEWLCQCDCGNETIVKSESLISGKVKSCGCLLKEANHKPWVKSQEKYKELTIGGVREPDFMKGKLKNNTSGYTGVSRKGNKWTAELIVKGVKHRAYGFDTPEDAYYKGRLRLEEEHLPPEIFKKMHKNNPTSD